MALSIILKKYDVQTESALNGKECLLKMQCNYY